MTTAEMAQEDTGSEEPQEEPETGTDAPEESTGEDVAKWKAMSRKNEAAAKKLADELAELRKQHETDQDKAIREAVEAARAETVQAFASERVADAVRVAAAKRDFDPEALIEGLDAGRFLGDDGLPDISKVNNWVEKITPEPTPQPFPDIGQGTRMPPHGLNSTRLEDDLKRALGIN